MLTGFLEHGARLSALSRSQIFGIETEATLYLIKAQNFNMTMARIADILGADSIRFKTVVKERLSALIYDPDCNCKFKPAVLRLAAGDTSGFRELGVPYRRTQSIIASYPRQFQQALTAVCHPIHDIGPRHVNALEFYYLNRVDKHVRNYVQKHARFLTMGDSTIDKKDIINDLRLLALCAMRGYYPFRSGLYMENSMRRTVTNRGRGFVTAATKESHRSVIQLPDGSSARREIAWVGPNDTGYPILDNMRDSCNANTMRINMVRIASKRRDIVGEVAKFALDPVRQDHFMSWLGCWCPACWQASDVAEAVQISARPYALLLARFLSLPRQSVDNALRELRDVAA